MNAWESIFRQSRVNNGYYDEDKLPQSKWDWPRETWFQARPDQTRDQNPITGVKAGRSFGRSDEMPRV
jgi:hypothetical protein